MPESMRQRLEMAEAERLAAWATCSAGATRRLPIEDEGRAFDYRTPYQRDRDRIVYSRAFRRLRHKAQMGILPEYEDHRRNRLTHTLEVAQLARTIGRALRLNEDLIEAVALGHDLGQPPFGATGARALDDLLAGRLDGLGGAGLGDLGGFQRSNQSLRVVDLLEKRYAHAGLNLTDAVREGILKTGRNGARSAGPEGGLRAGLAPPFEVQVVVLADQIATALHDLDDALQAGVLDLARVERLGALRELRRKLGRRYPLSGGRFVRANAIHRGLTHLMVTATILVSDRQLTRWAGRHAVRTATDFAKVRDASVQGDEIGMGRTMAGLLHELEGFLEMHVRRGFEAERVEARGRRVLLGLFAAYQADPGLLEDHVLFRFKEIAGGRFLRDLPWEAREGELDARYRSEPRFVIVLADHLAAMTDIYALREHERFISMGAVPIPGAEALRAERLRQRTKASPSAASVAKGRRLN